MQFRSRNDQVSPVHSLWTHVFGGSAPYGDHIFDTMPLPRPMLPVTWILETAVHRAVRITNKLRNSNQFVGVQTMIVRDEVRQQSHLIAIETDGLYKYTLINGEVVSRMLVTAGNVRRAHITLQKFDGETLIASVSEKDDGHVLMLNGHEVSTIAKDVDFPFVTIGQPPIGYPATVAPRDGLLLYKSRATNRLLAARFDPMTLYLQPEIELGFANPIGGADAIIGEKLVVLRAQVLDNGLIKTQTSTSSDNGSSFSTPVSLDLSVVPHDSEIPSNAPVCIDNTENFHIPVATKKGTETTLLDVHPDDDLIVAAITAPESTNHSLVVFPSMGAASVGFRQGFGDGLLDGNGMIATIGMHGRLLSANSQSGGYSYPDATVLNHEMQRVAGFRSTECYTRGADANVVSMDYAFVECDDQGNPTSSELWVETWDMPLPEPVVSYAAHGEGIQITIHKSGWFFPGQTAFEIFPANTFITKTELNGFREIVLEFDQPSLIANSRITFETKNAFLFYRGFVDIK